MKTLPESTSALVSLFPNCTRILTDSTSTNLVLFVMTATLCRLGRRSRCRNSRCDNMFFSIESIPLKCSSTVADLPTVVNCDDRS